MKKTTDVKAHTKHTKSGKIVNVKASKREYDAAEDIAKEAIRKAKGAGSEFEKRKAKPTDYDQYGFTKEEFEAWYENTDPKTFRKVEKALKEVMGADGWKAFKKSDAYNEYTKGGADKFFKKSLKTMEAFTGKKSQSDTETKEQKSNTKGLDALRKKESTTDSSKSDKTRYIGVTMEGGPKYYVAGNKVYSKVGDKMVELRKGSDKGTKEGIPSRLYNDILSKAADTMDKRNKITPKATDSSKGNGLQAYLKNPAVGLGIPLADITNERRIAIGGYYYNPTGKKIYAEKGKDIEEVKKTDKNYVALHNKAMSKIAHDRKIRSLDTMDRMDRDYGRLEKLYGSKKANKLMQDRKESGYYDERRARKRRK